MKKPTIVVFVSTVLLATVIVILWVGLGEDKKHVPVESSDLPITENETGIDTEEGKVAEESQAASTARRIIHVPGNNPETPQGENAVDNELQESTKKMLDSAIEGKTEDAINISQLLKQCSNRQDEGLVRSQLNHLRTATFSPSTTHSLSGVSGSFDSFEELESAMWQSFDQCRSIKSLFDDDLRELLKSMARNGSVTARYLYATWPPKHPDRIEPEYTLALLEYRNLAHEFTWRNLDEGEPLGVLAFAKSFAIGNPYLFSAPNFMQYQNFIFAAKKCGLSSPWLDTQVNQIRERWAAIGGINPVEEASDETAELFCDLE